MLQQSRHPRPVDIEVETGDDVPVFPQNKFVVTSVRIGKFRISKFGVVPLQWLNDVRSRCVDVAGEPTGKFY